MILDVNVGGYLQQAFATGHANHAYIVVGEKPSVATLLKQCAMVAMCPRHANDRCEVCNKVLSDAHQDVISVPTDKQKNKLTVADVAMVVEESYKRPVDNSVARVFLIDATNSAVGIGSETWQNKLLKTLEEPTQGVYLFIGVTDAEALLPTIRSRCQLLKQTKYTVAEVQAQLQNGGFDSRSCQMAAAMSGGSVQTGQRLLASPGVFKAYQTALDVATQMTSTKNALRFASQVLSSKENVADCLGFYTLLLRESLVYRLCPSLRLLPSFEREIKQICANYTLQAAQGCIELVNKAKKRLDDGGNLSVVVDQLLASILEMKFRCRS